MEFGKQYDRKLILEDGSEYRGYAFGGRDDRVCTLCFNSAMIGYQEIVSDPSYTDMGVVMTYPLIGNYGITDEDFKINAPTIGAMIVGVYNDHPSNFRCIKTLTEILEENGIPGIEGFDTRKLTRHLRENGTCRALLTGIDTTAEEGVRRIQSTPIPHDAVARVSCKKRWFSRTPDHLYNVVIVDCGTTLNNVRSLNNRDCNVIVVPYDTDAKTILSMKPDGLMLSDGPGDPCDVPQVVTLIQTLRGRLPIFGIGLGCQVIALAYGAKTQQMKCGHYGDNHPVRNLITNTVEIVAENHGYAVDAASVAGTGLSVTHMDVLDHTVEGVSCMEDRVFGVQFCPESAPGVQEPSQLIDLFITQMQEEKSNA